MAIKSLNTTNARTYTLLISNKKDTKIHIGRLGILDFKQGYYVYLGSAKNNFMARIKRHLSRNKNKFWHIDYLLLSRGFKIEEIWISSEEQECLIAKQLLELGYPYIKKFGSSDCRCQSHLFFVHKNLKRLTRILVKNGFKKFRT